jgi:hypothetical protein
MSFGGKDKSNGAREKPAFPSGILELKFSGMRFSL